MTTNTASVDLAAVREMVRQFRDRLAVHPDCYVCTMAVGGLIRRQLPEAFDPFGSLIGVPLYEVASEAECRALALKLRQEGKRPAVLTA